MAVVTDERSRQAPDLFDAFPDAVVHVLSTEPLPEWEPALRLHHHPARNLEHVHRTLTAIGPVDVIVNLRQLPAARHDAFFARLFYHLKPKGAYVLARQGVAAGADTPPSELKLMLRTAALLGASGEDLESAPARVRELSSATSSATIGHDYVIFTKRTKHFRKLMESDASRAIPTRNEDLEVRDLTVLPSTPFRSRARTHSHQAAVSIQGLNEDLTPPAMHVRHYEGRITVVSNMLVHSEYSILPDAFRHHLAANPSNVKARNANVDFARIPPNLRAHRELDGVYFLLDSENSGHYGHIMTDVVSRLWGWDVAKAAIPDLRALFRIRYPNERDPRLERQIFTAYGIPEADITWIDEPVAVRSVVGATPMWHNQAQQYVHPDIEQVWQRLRRSLARPVESSEKIFVSRSSHSRYRECRNLPAVESLFRHHGFDIVYPEQLDLGQQAGLFGQARVVAGFGGSGLFNVLFSERLETMIVLNQEAYTARNEHLFASVLGCDIHYFWSTPDVPHPTDGWSWDAYRSHWTFDLDRNGPELKQLLDSL